MFIGREMELQFLQDKYNDRRGQLIILYGRRRVGKTETLREFCRQKPHIFFSCTQSTDRVQLAKFSKQLLREDIPAKQYISEFADWEAAFRFILDLPYGDKKKPAKSLGCHVQRQQCHDHSVRQRNELYRKRAAGRKKSLIRQGNGYLQDE